MSKKILAIDLDDTTFDDNKDICKANLDALNAMLDAGHVLAVDTGRPTHVMKKLLKRFEVFDRENVYLLGYQGTVGTRATDDEVLFGHFLDNEAAIKLMTYSKNAGLTTIIFEFGQIYSFSLNADTDRYSEVSKEPITVIESPEDLRGHKLTKMMVVNFEDHEKLFQFEEAHKAEMEASFVSMFSNVAFLEYVGKDSSKGAGLTELASILDIDMKDTVACGDERNDISMVQAAGVGVAVANARDELKAVADYITVLDNNNGAVAEAINKFILNS